MLKIIIWDSYFDNSLFLLSHEALVLEKWQQN